ncbi:N-formylglutamate amidohydrolase [Sphingomonas lacunae]|uniref:N-formylglutamate amidohydrolase n=1 Tax=Sphingomonas lacunae TaxID=2698828 RepID=A0A6M4AVB7_9SPHN|nr:N-formylglutamate amidohydrolase [Sphingomonas lacunae]QJQ32626.1 N-formylglutamate amidohydrolase [Sphingomonas lacunae]
MNGHVPASADGAPFSLVGPAEPLLPVIITVPHAGRHYPPFLIEQARVPLSVLQRLEDRHADVLASAAAAAGFTVLVANTARALIDLNRAEDEWDCQIVSDALPPATPNQRVRAGLGLVPARLHPHGELWRGRISKAELDRRIATVHRPWHQRVAALLDSARSRFGRALLFDLHSMPTQPGGVPQMVLGDRYGLTASSRLVESLLALGEGQGLRVARNAPYAGAHGISLHGRPAAGVDAIQLEFDRGLYLGAGQQPEPAGTERVARLLLAMARAASASVGSARDWPAAAE